MRSHAALGIRRGTADAFAQRIGSARSANTVLETPRDAWCAREGARVPSGHPLPKVIGAYAYPYPMPTVATITH